MAARLLRAAVVGGSSLLGRELLNEVGRSVAAAWDLQLLEEDGESEGQLTAAGDEALVVHALDQESFTGLDIVFFAADPELTARYVDAAVAAGAGVVDLTGTTTNRSGFVMRSPWVASSQRPDLTTVGVSVPHPAALMLALAGERLGRSLGAGELAATVLEPASQAGSAGVDELHQQTVSLLSFQDPPKTVFDAQVAFNVQGALGNDGRVDLGTVQQKVRSDLQQLLGRESPTRIALQVLQAPVFHGSFVSAYLRTQGTVSVEAVKAALAGAPVETETEMPPSNRTATETGELMISVHPNQLAVTPVNAPESAAGFWLTMAADNLGLVAQTALGAALELTALRPGARVQ